MNNLNLTKEQQLLLIGLIVSFLVGLGVLGWRQLVPDNQMTVKADSAADETATVVIHISGAIRREGVYRLKAGDHLLDAINLAGGALPNAELTKINLAEVVKDGEKIIVPGKLSNIVQNNDNAAGVINLNTADEEQLDSLPGIGKSTAQQIIDYRQKKGPFFKVEQLLEIPRFGKAKLERIRDKIIL